MGLDMYLTAERYMYRTGDKEVSDKIKEQFPELETFGSIKTIKAEVAYWRKANQIHKWFVDNVQSGEDNCEYYNVTNEHLQQLLDTINSVLADRSLAQSLLPCQDGFFFGSTDYDVYYFEELLFTKEVVEKLLASDLGKQGWYIQYHSSW